MLGAVHNRIFPDPGSIPSFERAVQALEELTEQILQKEIKQV